MTFDADECQIWKGSGAESLAVLRHIALNLLKRGTSMKRSLKGKRMMAALDENCLLKVLIG